MTKQWVLTVNENGSGECFIELNDEILEASGFKEGDDIKWVDNLDGSYTIMHMHMKGYDLVNEVANAENSRHAMVYINKTLKDYVVDMYENDELIHSRKLTNHTNEYANDCVENWVMCYGEFKK